MNNLAKRISKSPIMNIENIYATFIRKANCYKKYFLPIIMTEIINSYLCELFKQLI